MKENRAQELGSGLKQRPQENGKSELGMSIYMMKVEKRKGESRPWYELALGCL